ncbi:MAG: type III pantothenate kinase [Bacteroidales bacterium]|jgi:type III pantothenate kinase
MNLILDIGNTATKVAVFNGKEKLASFRIKELTCESIEKEMSSFSIDKAIICSAKALPEFIEDLLVVNIPFHHVLSGRSRLPFAVEYETPDTLGPDRIAAAAGALHTFPDSDLLVIDAGSAITFDYLIGGIYKGGNISPGLEMRFKALNMFTGRLPLMTASDEFSSPGKNTRDAIIAGVVNGIIFEINEYIRTFIKMHPGSHVIITGGNGAFLEGKIGYEVKYLPDIVIEGLNIILEYNAQ